VAPSRFKTSSGQVGIRAILATSAPIPIIASNLVTISSLAGVELKSWFDSILVRPLSLAKSTSLTTLSCFLIYSISMASASLSSIIFSSSPKYVASLGSTLPPSFFVLRVRISGFFYLFFQLSLLC